MNAKSSLAAILVLAVSVLQVSGAHAASALKSVMDESQAAAASGDLGAASRLASQSLDGLLSNRKNPPEVHISLAPSKAEPVALSASRKPEIKPVPALAAAVEAPEAAEKRSSMCRDNLHWEPTRMSTSFAVPYCSISNNGTGGILSRIGGGIAGALSYAAVGIATIAMLPLSVIAAVGLLLSALIPR